MTYVSIHLNKVSGCAAYLMNDFIVKPGKL